MGHHNVRHLALTIAGTATLAITSLAGVGPSEGAAAPTCHGRVATIVGTAAANQIQGTSGPDVIVGRGGNDHIEGRGGNDFICGNLGRDVLEGQGGNDHLYGGLGFDTADGGRGTDVCVAERRESC